ncbi:TAT (twin-arginine translocation) pathway signal sequence, partial [Prauserella aidingensis]|uniref:peptidoglycan-binding domain-containing protein n=1 Tax=Prauserella aidingensis TaxID=387890 RepID=UPI0020A3D755
MKNLRPVTRRSMLRGTAVAGMAAAASVLIPTSAQAASMSSIQKSLKGLYYYRGVIDGYAGPMTTDAVEAFQS